MELWLGIAKSPANVIPKESAMDANPMLKDLW